MQQNLQNKRSYLIRLTDLQKKKARRQLIGSLFLLLIALITLLNVTSRLAHMQKTTKKVVVEVKPTASFPLNIESQQKAIGSSESNLSITPIDESKVSNKPTVVVVESSIRSIANTIPAAKKPAMFNAHLVADVDKTQSHPEDILAGNSHSKHKADKYYIQLIASSDKAKLTKFQRGLASMGIKTVIQDFGTKQKKLYRLRAGPFANKEDANRMLNNINRIDHMN